MYKWACAGDFGRHVRLLNYASVSFFPSLKLLFVPLLCFSGVFLFRTQMFSMQLSIDSMSESHVPTQSGVTHLFSHRCPSMFESYTLDV